MCSLGFKFRRNFHSVVLSQDSRHHLDMCVMHTHCPAPNTPPIPALPSTLLRPFVRQSVNFTSVGRSQHFFVVSAPTGISMVYGQLMIYGTDNLQFRLIHVWQLSPLGHSGTSWYHDANKVKWTMTRLRECHRLCQIMVQQCQAPCETVGFRAVAHEIIVGR